MRRSFHTALVGLGLLCLVSGPVATTAGEAVDPGVLADAIRFRGELGFTTEPHLVTDLLTSGQANPFGLPLRDDEWTELVRRGEVADRLANATAFVEAHPADFGGAFFDQSVGDMLLVVQTLSDTPTASLDDLRTLLPSGLRVELRTAGYSAAYLAMLQEDLFASLSDDPTTTTYVDTRANQVVVEIGPSARSRAALLLSGLGDAARIQEGEGLQAVACVYASHARSLGAEASM